MPTKNVERHSMESDSFVKWRSCAMTCIAGAIIVSDKGCMKAKLERIRREVQRFRAGQSVGEMSCEVAFVSLLCICEHRLGMWG